VEKISLLLAADNVGWVTFNSEKWISDRELSSRSFCFTAKSRKSFLAMREKRMENIVKWNTDATSK
jgi:hypothetical protein